MPPRFFRGVAAMLVSLVFLVLGSVSAQAEEANPLDSIVGVRANIPSDAATAPFLGTERAGSGVVIGPDGMVVTIGYLIMESESAEILLQDGREIPAELAAYDFDTGFGLLRPLVEHGVPSVELGDSSDLEASSEVLVAGLQGPHAAHVATRREFAGYWEYLLPNAIFTTPPYQAFGGAALFGPEGRLLGIGSLILGDIMESGAAHGVAGNMFVPVEALTPILDELVAQGRGPGPARPWLGIYAGEERGHLFINRVAANGPAAAAGLRKDDILLAVGETKVDSLAGFYKAIWARGDAGVEVPITVLRDGAVEAVDVESADRYDHLRQRTTY